MIFWQRAVVWEQISCVYFRPRGAFSANFCPMLIAFLQTEIQSAIDRSPSLFGGLDYWTGLLDSRKMPPEGKITGL